MLALDFERGGRRAGVGAGLLQGNAVNEACERIAAMVDPAFLVNAIVDERGRVEQVFAGHWRATHRRACDVYSSSHTEQIRSKREVVIVSCGGSPYDINMIQAHKALDMAAEACVKGGAIILLAECRDGLGRADFLKWFDSSDQLKDLRGSSQGVHTKSGFLFVVHRKCIIDGKMRFSHQFIELGHDLQPLRILDAGRKAARQVGSDVMAAEAVDQPKSMSAPAPFFTGSVSQSKKYLLRPSGWPGPPWPTMPRSRQTCPSAPSSTLAFAV